MEHYFINRSTLEDLSVKVISVIGLFRFGRKD